MDTSTRTYQWAPIVRARTFAVDFRFIVVPSFFADSLSEGWALRHIVDASEYTEKLAQHPRLSLFQNASVRVHGVTCIVSDMIGAQDPKAKDERCRTLYAFLGYAAMRDDSGEFPSIPSYVTTLTLYAGLYDYVRRHWDEDKPTPAEISELNRAELSPAWWAHGAIADAPQDADLSPEPPMEFKLNGNPDQIRLWPDSLDTRIRLWQEASRCHIPLSLCLGLAFERPRNAKATSFLNAAVAGTLEGGELIDKDSAAMRPNKPT